MEGSMSDSPQEGYFMPVKLVGGDHSADDFLLCEVKEGRLVKKIGVYFNAHYKWIQGIQVTYTDDKESRIMGTASDSYKELTLEPGETIKRASISTETSSVGVQIGRIEFTTSKNETFIVGEETTQQTNHQIPVGSGYLAGFTGYFQQTYRPISASFACGFKKLGLIFLKHIKGVLISHVELVRPPGSEAIKPEQLAYSEFRNIGREKMEYNFTNSIARTNSFSFTSSTSKQFPKGLKVEFGIPNIVKVNGEFGWESGETESLGWTKSDTTTLTWSVSGKVNPGHIVVCTATCQHGQVDVDYKSKVTLTFVGTSDQLTYSETGTLHNTSFAFSTAEATERPLL